MLLPLLALFVGLGTIQTVNAQTTITADAITLNVKGGSTTYNTQSTTPGAGVFSGANIGTFNLGNPSDVLALNGATLTVNDPTGNYNDGQLLYRIYQTGGSAPGYTTVSLGSGSVSGGVRTFTLNGLTTNLLTGLTGGAGTGYNFNVVFRANDNNTFGNPVIDTPVKTATFTVTGAPAPTITADAITLNVKGGSTTYNTQSTTPGVGVFSGANIGTFNLGNPSDVLALNGATLTINDPTGNYNDGQLLYRVYKTGGSAPGFTTVSLGSGSVSGGVRTFTLNGLTTNLLAGLTGGAGTGYNFDVVFRANDNTNFGNPLIDTPVKTATFTVTSASSPTITGDAITLNVKGGSTTYNTQSTTPGAGVFSGANIGTFNLGNPSDVLALNGATLTVNDPTGNYNDGQLLYRIYQTGGSAPGYTTVSLGSGSVSGGVRTFTLNGLTTNLLTGLTGGAGTGYNFDVVFRANDNNTFGNPVIDTPVKTATFTVTGAPTPTPTLTLTTAFVSANGAADVTYDINNGANSKPFNGANLGTFDINTGKLLLDGGTATTTESGGNTISSVTLYYRTRLNGSGGGAFSPISLGQTNVVTNADGSRTRSFSLNTAGQNLLNNISTNNTFNVDLYLQASGSNGSATFNITDTNGGSNYVASFTVTGTPIITTVWTGGVNDNWFDAGNWDKGVPTANTNARIPDFASGTTVNYPNIYSGVVNPGTKATTVTNPDGTVDNIPASPGYDNTNSGNAQVRDLTMNGSTQLQRSILRLIQGRLDVFGDFNNPQGSFIQRSGGIISFKSQGNQTISGSINGFTNIEIDGGATSIKTLTNSFAIKAGGYLKFINGILQTDISLVSSNFISFDAATTDPSTGVVVLAAQMIGETNTSYFRGFLTTTQIAPVGTTQNFSNTGITLSFTGNDPGNVTVTRNTGGNYAPSAFGGGSPKPSIRRVYGVQPTNSATNSGGLNAVVTFAYQDNELVNLRVNTTNPPDYSGAVDKTKASLYVSTTGGNSFSQLGRDSNMNNVLTKSGVTTFATFTISEQATPLPVKLVAFDAKRTGTNVLVTWATAMEISNSGFEVQVSTDGNAFRKIAFVASAAINSTSALQYSFLDEEAGKTGIRYYRLRQIDQDGKDEYSPVRVVNFSNGASNSAQATTLTLFPNPFVEGEQPTLLVQAATAGAAHLQILDILGREVAHQDFVSLVGIQQVDIPQVAALSTGIYVAKVTLATGEVKTIRLQKR